MARFYPEIAGACQRFFQTFFDDEGVLSGTLVHLDSGVYCSSKASLNVRTIIGLPMSLEGALFCEKWHKDESEIVQVLRRILPDTADVAEVLGQAQSIEGSLMELEFQIRKPYCWAGVRSFWTISKGYPICRTSYWRQTSQNPVNE